MFLNVSECRCKMQRNITTNVYPYPVITHPTAMEILLLNSLFHAVYVYGGGVDGWIKPITKRIGHIYIKYGEHVNGERHLPYKLEALD